GRSALQARRPHADRAGVRAGHDAVRGHEASAPARAGRVGHHPALRAGEASLPEPGTHSADPRPVDRQVHRAPGIGARESQALFGGEVMSNTIQMQRVYIKATPQAIWAAITKPEWTEQYGYAPLVDYDMRAGGRFRAYPNEGMKQFPSVPSVILDGEVIEADPPRKLVQTWRMLMDPGLAAEGFTRLTYEIAEGKGGVSKLTVIHELEGAPALSVLVAGGLEEQGAGGGWSWVLSDLKSLLE